MLKKTYRNFLIAGMAVGVVTGIFFICLLQRQITDTAEAAKARRLNEQNAFIYQSPRDVPENTVFAMSPMSPEQYEAAARLIPASLSYAPIAQTLEEPGAVVANHTTMSGVSVVYSTTDFFPVKGMTLLEGTLVTASGTCAASQFFLDACGLELSDSPIVEIHGRQFRVTAVFEAAEDAAGSDDDFFRATSANLLVLPYGTQAAGENVRATHIVVKRPEGLALEEFEALLSQLEQELNAQNPDPDTVFHALTGAAFQESKGVSLGAFIFLGIFLLAFLGEFLAGVNMMSLASAGVLKGKRKVGLKLAVGASYGGVFREFLGELLLICAKGALLGIAVAAVLVYYANKFMGDFLFLFNGTTVLLSGAVILCVCFAAAYFPFRYILKRQPAALLRQE